MFKSIKKRVIKLFVVAGVLSSFLISQAYSQLPNFKNEFGRIKGEMPGCAVGIVHEGELIFEQYYGYSNIKYNVLNDENTKFNIGSISKHITASIFFRLEKNELISREDSLIEFYPDGPKWFSDIKIKHLIAHQSGIPDFINDPVFSLNVFEGIATDSEAQNSLIFGKKVTHDQIMSVIMENLKALPKPSFEAGSNAYYSNTGYVILGDIIQNISEHDFEYWLNEFILAPNDIQNIISFNNTQEQLKWMATGYTKSTGVNSQYIEADERLRSYGDGGIKTNLKDIAKWMGVLLQSANSDSPWSGFLVNKDTSNEHYSELGVYENGLSVGEFKDNSIYSHNGYSLDSMTSEFWVSPEKNVGYVQLCNGVFRKSASKFKVFKYVEEYLKLQEKSD